MAVKELLIMRKVGDKIMFSFDVYEIYSNVEVEYDHTDTLTGVIEQVLNTDCECGKTVKYVVRVTGTVNTIGYHKYVGNVITVSDTDVYTAEGAVTLLYPELRIPTKEQIKLILETYDSNKSIEENVENIQKEWCHKVLGNMNEYFES